MIELTADASSFAPTVQVFTRLAADGQADRRPARRRRDERPADQGAVRCPAGSIYRIAVRADGWGAFKLDWRPQAAPANDDFAAAMPLTGDAGTVRQ